MEAALIDTVIVFWPMTSCEPMIVTLPPTTDPTAIAPGTELRLGLAHPASVHVVEEEAGSEPPLVDAEIVVPA